jgi:hypothetical protein
VFYEVYREENGVRVLIGTTSERTFTDHNRVKGETTTYVIVAKSTTSGNTVGEATVSILTE